MKTINFKDAFILLAFTLFTLCTSSCSKEDAEDTDIELPGDNDDSDNDEVLSSELKPFIGVWDRESGANYPTRWVFYADQTCSGKFKGGSSPRGQWGFSSKDNILSTTVNGWQYLITLKTDSHWSGVSLGGSNTVSFYRPKHWENEFALCILFHYSWFDEKGNELSFHSNLEHNKWGASYHELVYIYTIENGETRTSSARWNPEYVDNNVEDMGYEGVKIFVTKTWGSDLNYGWEKHAKQIILSPNIYSKQPTIELDGHKFTAKYIENN